MTFGSLFAGVGGLDMGFDAAGLTPVWQVEIDPTYRSVLNRHWPGLLRLSDVRECGKQNLPKVDVIVGGFPCQGLSLAGQRKGLKDDRSGLFYEMLRIVRELRPRYLVWENVAGLGSSDNGRDFMRILSHLADAHYFGCVRRVDAQWYGVPQQRRRYFGVFTRGHSGVGRCAQILAVAESLSRHPAESGEARPRIARTIDGGSPGRGYRIAAENAENAENLVYGGNDTRGERGVCAALSAKAGSRQDFETENFVVAFHPTQDPINGNISHCIGQGNKQGGSTVAVCIAGERTHSLTHEGSDASEDGTGRGTPIVFQTRIARNGRGQPKRIVDSLTSSEGGSHADSKPHVAYGSIVRRLTPLECERLMGWPDFHTKYRDDGTEIKDGPRYRMIGNGVVKPCAEWIGRRLMEFG